MNDSNHDLTKLEYPGELTLEALATLDVYIKQCCNSAATARKLHKQYLQVRKYLKQPYVREIFQLKLMQKGITPEKIADVIKAGCDATNGVYYEGGKVADEDNWAARQKFVQLACEIFEVLKYQYKIDNNVLFNQYNITNLQGEALVAEAKRRGIPIPEPIARRLGDTRKP